MQAPTGSWVEYVGKAANFKALCRKRVKNGGQSVGGGLIADVCQNNCAAQLVGGQMSCDALEQKIGGFWFANRIEAIKRPHNRQVAIGDHGRRDAIIKCAVGRAKKWTNRVFHAQQIGECLFSLLKFADDLLV